MMDRPVPEQPDGPSVPERTVHTLGVGGWVVRGDGRVLLVRMTYGPAQGRLMIPGGHCDPGEFLDDTAVREVLEETGIAALPRGVLLVRQRQDMDPPNLYLVLLMTPERDTAACPDGHEVSECVWLTPAEILARDDIQPIARELAAAYDADAQTCLGRRGLTWREAHDYRLWAGTATQPPDWTG